MITGGSGAGMAEFHFKLHGSMADTGGSKLTFVVNAGDLFGADAGTMYQELKVELLSADYGGIGTFEQFVVAYIDFTYNQPFKLESGILLQAWANGAIDFTGTASVEQVILPGGASLHSSAISSGDVDPSVYSVPEPAAAALILTSAYLLTTRRRHHA